MSLTAFSCTLHVDRATSPLKKSPPPSEKLDMEDTHEGLRLAHHRTIRWFQILFDYQPNPNHVVSNDTVVTPHPQCIHLSTCVRNLRAVRQIDYTMLGIASRVSIVPDASIFLSRHQGSYLGFHLCSIYV